MKKFINNTLKYKANLNLKIEFVCVAMHSLVMSPCLRDLIVMSLVVKLIGTWFLDSEPLICYTRFSCSMNYISRMDGAAYTQFSTVVQLSMEFQFVNSSMSS